MEQYLRQGLVSGSKVLDIRQVDVSGNSFPKGYADSQPTI